MISRRSLFRGAVAAAVAAIVPARWLPKATPAVVNVEGWRAAELHLLDTWADTRPGETFRLTRTFTTSRELCVRYHYGCRAMGIQHGSKVARAYLDRISNDDRRKVAPSPNVLSIVRLREGPPNVEAYRGFVNTGTWLA